MCCFQFGIRRLSKSITLKSTHVNKTKLKDFFNWNSRHQSISKTIKNRKCILSLYKLGNELTQRGPLKGLYNTYVFRRVVIRSWKQILWYFDNPERERVIKQAQEWRDISLWILSPHKTADTITQFVKNIDCCIFFSCKTEVRPLRDTLRVFLQVKQILNLTRFYLRSWKKVAEHAKLFNSNWLSL